MSDGGRSTARPAQSADLHREMQALRHDVHDMRRDVRRIFVMVAVVFTVEMLFYLSIILRIIFR